MQKDGLVNSVSVIIPVYNGERFIGEALESVFRQSLPPHEVIVVNDGSIDGTRNIVRRYKEKIIYLEQENSGPASARNKGIEKAQGEYIAFLDSDDIWMRDKLEIQLKCFAENPFAAMVYTKMVNFRDSDGKELEVRPSKVVSGWIVDEILTKGLILLSTVMIKKEIIKEIGGFDETLPTAEDTNMYIKIARQSEVLGIDEVLVKRRRHRGNMSDRTDITRGTLDSLDKLITSYPEMHPKRYYPMRVAYLDRGRKMMMEYYNNKEFDMCRSICRRLLSVKNMDPHVLTYYALASLSTRLKARGR